MQKKHFVLGGDLKKSLAEGYQLDFKLLFKEAAIITRKNYFMLLGASLLATILLFACFQFSFGHLAKISNNALIVGMYGIVVCIIPLFLTGLQMMAIHHSIGLKSKVLDLFNYFPIFLKLSLATLIISLIKIIVVILTQVLGDMGLLLSIVVMLYLNMTFIFVYPLIAEKKVNPQAALMLSFKLVNKNILQFTLLFIGLSLLFLIAAVSGFGLFLFIPFYFNLMGVIYRQLCGVGVIATEISKSDNDAQDNDKDDSDPSGRFDA